MEIQIFTIPITDGGAMQEEMNKFLRGHKVLEVQQELVTNNRGSYWCFCIRYIKGGIVSSNERKREKVDYREVLSEEVFSIYNSLRECRKAIAEKEAIPVYAVFTNAELAKIAALEELNVANLQSIKGIGKNKSEKFGKLLVECYQSKNNQ